MLYGRGTVCLCAGIFFVAASSMNTFAWRAFASSSICFARRLSSRCRPNPGTASTTDFVPANPFVGFRPTFGWNANLLLAAVLANPRGDPAALVVIHLKRPRRRVRVLPTFVRLERVLGLPLLRRGLLEGRALLALAVLNELIFLVRAFSRRVPLSLLDVRQPQDPLGSGLTQAFRVLRRAYDLVRVPGVRVERAVLVEQRPQLLLLSLRLGQRLLLPLEERPGAAADALLCHHVDQPPRVLVQLWLERVVLLRSDALSARVRPAPDGLHAHAFREKVDAIARRDAGFLLEPARDGAARLAHPRRERQVRVLELDLDLRRGHGLLPLSKQVADALVDRAVPVLLHRRSRVVVDRGLERKRRHLGFRELPLRVLPRAVLVLPRVVQPIRERQRRDLVSAPAAVGLRHLLRAVHLWFKRALPRLGGSRVELRLLAPLPQRASRRRELLDVILPGHVLHPRGRPRPPRAVRPRFKRHVLPLLRGHLGGYRLLRVPPRLSLRRDVERLPVRVRGVRRPRRGLRPRPPRRSLIRPHRAPVLPRVRPSSDRVRGPRRRRPRRALIRRRLEPVPGVRRQPKRAHPVRTAAARLRAVPAVPARRRRGLPRGRAQPLLTLEEELLHALAAFRGGHGIAILRRRRPRAIVRALRVRVRGVSLPVLVLLDLVHDLVAAGRAEAAGRGRGGVGREL
eukprot:30936-Pelagococcus_subviridis.AAC.21